MVLYLPYSEKVEQIKMGNIRQDLLGYVKVIT